MSFLDLIFPKSCVSCSKKGNYFCVSCLNKLKPIFQICPACARVSFFGQTHLSCLRKDSLDGLFSLFNYEGIVRQAIHQLKYKLVTDLENEFWLVIKKQMGEQKETRTVLDQFIRENKPIILPLPLHWYKQNLRGFNQSSLFAKRLSNLFKLSYSDKILVRHKSVESQTKLTRKEREQNVKGIFFVPPTILNSKFLIHNSNILLIDDVWTTGSTMKEAVKVLKEAGIKKVWGITIAR